MGLDYLYAKKSAGFTLIELLVVISIISLLSSAVLSSLSGARESAKTTRLVSDFKQIEKAFILWMDANGRTQYPNETIFGSSNPTLEQAVQNTDLSEYLNAIPDPPFGNTYIYDYDSNQFSCGKTWSRGANIFVRNVPSDVKKEVNRIIEDDTDSSGNQDLDCGRVRASGNWLAYSLSMDGDL